MGAEAGEEGDRGRLGFGGSRGGRGRGGNHACLSGVREGFQEFENVSNLGFGTF